MVPQHEFFWMRIQIDLVLNVLDLMHRHMVLDERDRDDEGHEPIMIVPQNAVEIRALLGRQLFFQEPDQMLQDVHVFAPRCLNGQGGHEQGSVKRGQSFWRITMRLSDQSTQ